MLSRRALMLAGGGLALAVGPARAAAVMTDDGFYREDWFLDSFLDLADDAFLARDLLGKDVARELHGYGGKTLRKTMEW